MRLVQLKWCNFLIILNKSILESGENGLVHCDFYRLKCILYLKKIEVIEVLNIYFESFWVKKYLKISF
jgi:hypothetical protein